MRLFQAVPESLGLARHGNQVHMIRHQAVTQQRKTRELRILPQQRKIDHAIGVVGENNLPGISSLRNMMRNVDHPTRANRAMI
jgi:hypothetical protein